MLVRFHVNMGKFHRYAQACLPCWMGNKGLNVARKSDEENFGKCSLVDNWLGHCQVDGVVPALFR